MSAAPLINFATEEAAFDWMMAWLHSRDEYCIDGQRFAFDDDAEQVLKYEEIQRGGCCGFFDREIMVAGRKAKIGCNYGH